MDSPDRFRCLSFQGVAAKASRPPRRPAIRVPFRLPAPARSPPEAAAHSSFVRWLFLRSGLDPLAYRPGPIERRILACLRALRVGSPEEARRLLEKDPSLLPAAVSALVLGVTEFFRDRSVFEDLRTKVIPGLSGRGTAGIRVWSAACANGAELCSIAVLLAEAGVLGESELLGSDPRPDAVGEARDGRYDLESIRGVPPALRKKYFIEEGRDVRVAPSLRERARWEVGDVMTFTPGKGWHIVLFRNVAIYLRPEAASFSWERLSGSLAEGGFLVTGKAERPQRGLGLTRIEPCIYHKAPEMVHGFE